MQPHLRRRTEEGWTLLPFLITGAIYRWAAAAAAAPPPPTLFDLILLFCRVTAFSSLQGFFNHCWEASWFHFSIKMWRDHAVGDSRKVHSVVMWLTTAEACPVISAGQGHDYSLGCALLAHQLKHKSDFHLKKNRKRKVCVCACMRVSVSFLMMQVHHQGVFASSEADNHQRWQETKWTALFPCGKLPWCTNTTLATAILQQSLQNKNMLARNQQQQQQPSTNWRLLIWSRISELYSDKIHTASERENNEGGSRRGRHRTRSSITPQACFTVPYPGTILQEQRPLSRQLWRNRTEWWGTGRQHGARADSSHCSSSSGRCSLKCFHRCWSISLLYKSSMVAPSCRGRSGSKWQPHPHAAGPACTCGPRQVSYPCQGVNVL